MQPPVQPPPAPAASTTFVVIPKRKRPEADAGGGGDGGGEGKRLRRGDSGGAEGAPATSATDAAREREAVEQPLGRALFPVLAADHSLSILPLHVLSRVVAVPSDGAGGSSWDVITWSVESESATRGGCGGTGGGSGDAPPVVCATHATMTLPRASEAAADAAALAYDAQRWLAGGGADALGLAPDVYDAAAWREFLVPLLFTVGAARLALRVHRIATEEVGGSGSGGSGGGTGGGGSSEGGLPPAHRCLLRHFGFRTGASTLDTVLVAARWAAHRGRVATCPWPGQVSALVALEALEGLDARWRLTGDPLLTWRLGEPPLLRQRADGATVAVAQRALAPHLPPLASPRMPPPPPVWPAAGPSFGMRPAALATAAGVAAATATTAAATVAATVPAHVAAPPPLWSVLGATSWELHI